VLEANAVERVVQLDVDAQVVRVELELVARPDPGIFVDVERQRRDPPVDAQLPVPIALGEASNVTSPGSAGGSIVTMGLSSGDGI